MNIETLYDHVKLFTREVIDSGFKRDLDDYVSSLPSSQGNIIALRDVATKVLQTLESLYLGDLPSALDALMPREQVRPFTETPHDQELRKLISNTTIQQNDFFNQLTQRLSQLKKQVDQTAEEVTKIKKFIDPYVAESAKHIAADKTAIIAIVFIEKEATTSLKHFTKTISAWNRVLPIYHQLIRSSSPKDIAIVEVQNGSIEFVVNLDIKVAMDLVELFKLGFEVFAAYLAYKKMVKPIIASYHGNKKLIGQEEEREQLLLENIGTAVTGRLHEQHKAAKKHDKAVDGTAVAKKVEQVANLITSHIVRGNDIKLLAIPETEQQESGETSDSNQEGDTLREQSNIARRHLREISGEARQKLLETYGKLKDEEDI